MGGLECASVALMAAHGGNHGFSLTLLTMSGGALVGAWLLTPRGQT